MKNQSSEARAYCFCALDGTMNLLGKKWVLFTINVIGNHGTVRFTDLSRELQGISQSTLAWILKNLEHAGIVERKSFAEIPPRVEYSLTRKGSELRKALLPLLFWAAKQDDYSKKVEKCDQNQYVRVNII